MAETRPYWLFTAGVFAVGAILALVKSEWTAFFVFVVLLASVLWIVARVTKLSVQEPGDGPKRPSERRAARRAERASRAK